MNIEKPAGTPVEKKRLYLLRKWFVTGLLFLAPFFLTLWIVFKVFSFADSFLGVPIQYILEKVGVHITLHGVGFTALVGLILLTGWFTHQYLGARLFNLLNNLVTRIPLINKVYTAIQQIAQALLGGQKEVFKQAVLIEYPRRGVYCIGFVTQDTRGPIQDAITEDVISIFLPTTPNPTSGFLLFVPKNEVYYLDVAVPEALKLIISGGAIVPEEGRGSYTTAAKLGINLKPAPYGKHSGGDSV